MTERALVLCHFTAVEVAPPDLVELAARAGFGGVTLMLQWPRGYPPMHPMIGPTPMGRETRARLRETGLVLYDAATCRLEAGDVPEEFRPMMESAAELGARRITVEGNDPDRTRLTETFAGVCELAAEHGLSVGLEFMMSTRVRSLACAVDLIERSGAENTAVIVDALHLARSGGSPADVAVVPPGRLAYLQLSDAPLAPPVSGFAQEAVRDRLLPGEGDLPLRALIEAAGPDVPIGVEAPSQARRDGGVSDEAYVAAAMRSVHRLITDE